MIASHLVDPVRVTSLVRIGESIPSGLPSAAEVGSILLPIAAAPAIPARMPQLTRAA